MLPNPSTPWHKASFDHFLQESLPQLLGERLPLVGYQIEQDKTTTCRIQVTLAGGNNNDIHVTYLGIPQPDSQGLFTINGKPIVVIPLAADEDLEKTTVRCVGEQLYDFIAERLGTASSDQTWDSDLLQAWLPLESWINEFFQTHGQKLDTTNWLSRHTHLRRLVLEKWENVITPSQKGRVCPLEMPEGPNLGRVFTIALGAEVRDSKLITIDERPEAGLGLTASMIPFIEHSDPNRLLMGANMLRQWIVPEKPEPALVQTGSEPQADDFWNGRNLLTAFISWDIDTFSDGIVLSESAARKLDTPYPAEPGDKLSNRHGTKGVVSRILPDKEMPHLADGTPVELIYNFASLHMRLNFGQVREAVMGRIAHAEGKPAIIPAFQAPTANKIRSRLKTANLPESGMERLTHGHNDDPLPYPSTVGWVYWGKTVHLSRAKVRGGPDWEQRQGVMEAYALHQVDAYENLRELIITRAARNPESATLAKRLVAGPVEQATTRPPIFTDLVERLQAAGIATSIEDEKLAFHLATPNGECLELAHPLPHPWLSEHQLSVVGAHPALSEEYAQLAAANKRLASVLASKAPARLEQDAQAKLKKCLGNYFEALLKPKHLYFGENLVFSGRAVITPGPNLHIDQVGLPEEICWKLFEPLVIRESGETTAVQQRTEQATRALDMIMTRTWVLINRAPTLTPEAIIAFHPVRDPGHVIRLHPLACHFLNADFDGDQVAFLLPVTEAAQAEAETHLTIAGHLAHDPGLLKNLLPPLDALWGLAKLSLDQAGREALSEIISPIPDGLLSNASLLAILEKKLPIEGISRILEILDRLIQRGFAEAKRSGASLNPFAGENLPLPHQPPLDDIESWAAYSEELSEIIATQKDYTDPDIGPQVLMIKTQASGVKQLTWLVCSDGIVTDVSGNVMPVRHSLVAGLTTEEMYAVIDRARRALAKIVTDFDDIAADYYNRHQPTGSNLLARAYRAERPGVVFARAAVSGEVDPLTNVDNRLLVGLPLES